MRRRSGGILLAVMMLAAGPLAAQTGGAPLTLAEVVARALKNNPGTRAAYAQAQASAALYRVARGSLLPTLTLNAPLSRSRSLAGSTSLSNGDRIQFTPGITLSYLLFDFGGRSGNIAEAKAAAVAANAQNDSNVSETVLRAEAAYFAFNAARDLLDAREANLRTATEARDAALQREQVGLATVADTLQAATAVAQARLSLLTARGDLQAARGELAAVMGTTAAEPFEVAATTPMANIEAVDATVDSLMALAARARPELAAARARSQAADAGIRVARSLALPSFTLGGNAGRTLSNQDRLNGNSYGLSLGLQMPLFAGGARVNGLRAAHETADAARANAEAMRVQVANQVYTSYSTLGVAAARVQASSQLLASAEQSETVARGRYQEGVGSIIDLLTAQSALAEARAQAAQSRWTWQTALAQLAHDVGTLDASGDSGLPLTTDVPSIIAR